MVQFLDYATKYSWIYSMRKRSEFDLKFKDFILVKLKVFMVQIKHYHYDGGAELISKAVLGMLKEFGATYSWNPAYPRAEFYH